MGELFKTQSSQKTVSLFEVPSDEYVNTALEKVKAEVGEKIYMTLEQQLNPELVKQIFASPIYLHVKWHYNCYYFYAEYYYEAWVTSTIDPGGPRLTVDRIELWWKHGPVHDFKAENGITMVAHTDKTYNSGCDEEICVKAILRHNGLTAVAMSPENCIPL